MKSLNSVCEKLKKRSDFYWWLSGKTTILLGIVVIVNLIYLNLFLVISIFVLSAVHFLSCMFASKLSSKERKLKNKKEEIRRKVDFLKRLGSYKHRNKLLRKGLTNED